MASETPGGSTSFTGFDASGNAKVHAGHVYTIYNYNGVPATPLYPAAASSDAPSTRKNDAETTHICDHPTHFECQTDLETIATSGCVRGLQRYLESKEKRKEIEDWRGPYEYYSSDNARTGRMLHFSAARGHLHMVQTLCTIVQNIFILDGNDMPESGSGCGTTALHVAAFHGHMEVVTFFLTKSGRFYTDDYKASPLHVAVRFPAVLTKLLEAGYYVDGVNRVGDSPLHVAALEGARAGAQVLIGRGARLELKNKAGLTSLHVASRRGRSEVVSLLLERGANLLARDNSGATPLHLAASYSKTENVRILLECGADVAVLDKRDRTALDHAAIWGDTESTRLLLDKGASFKNTCAADAWSACHVAVNNCRTEMVQLLLDCEVFDMSRTIDSRTLLDVAAGHGYAKIVRLLLDHGADMGARSNTGWTPLHRAAYHGRMVTARILLDAGSDISVKTQDASTPLHLAVRGGHENMVQLLLARGADTRAVMLNGETPLQSAKTSQFQGSNEQKQSIVRMLNDSERKSTSQQSPSPSRRPQES